MQTWLQQSEQAIRAANRRIGWVWALACVLLIALVWGAAAIKITLDRQHLLDKLQADTEFRAKSSAEQLLRTVSQIDQLSMSIKYQWERNAAPLDLEEQYRKGVYQGGLYPVALDADGFAVTSTRNLARGTFMGDLDFFTQTRQSKHSMLMIAHPTEGRGGFAGKQIVRFSRSLNKADGSFDGAVLIAVELDSLMSFHEMTQLIPGDSLSVQFTDGAALAVRGSEGRAGIFLASPSLDQKHGTRLVESASGASQPHAVSWQRLEDYPLVAIAASNVDSALAPYRSTQLTYVAIAALVSLMLAGVAVFGAISQIRQSVQRRHQSQVQATFRLAVDGAREAFYMIRPIEGDSDEWLLEDCNERAAEMQRRQRNELVGSRLSELYEGRLLAGIQGFLRKVQKDGFMEDEFSMPDGSSHVAGWFQRRGVRSGAGIAVTVRDVTESRKQAEKLVTLVRTDSLTGLPNRHWLNDFLPAALECARERGRKVALLYLDLDNFKNINDALGHRTGDEVLQKVGEELRSALRHEDYLVRTGGDEFTVVIEDLGDDASKVVGQVAAKLMELLAGLGAGTSWRMFSLKASIGISLYPEHGGDVDSLMRAADIAMYEAKALGRAQFQYYDESFAERIRERISIEHALEQAIRNDEFVIYYQPRADARSGRLCGMEALIRWQHPVRGLVPPLEFIGVAEQTGLIVPIGDLVVKKVCSQIATWRNAGVQVKPVSINVSALQLRTDGLRQALATYLAEYGLPASMVAIELTESSMLDEGGVAQEELRNLRNMGVELEIDDFGTGYSSLSKLQSLDIDVLKIDRSFVQRVGDDEQAHALCDTMVSIGRSLHITVVAEGVERAEQLAALQRMGCDQIQGYLLAPPVPADEIPDLIDKNFFPSDLQIA